MSSECRTLTVLKGKEQFSFRYEVGQEAIVMDAMVEKVNRRDSNFGWFEVAVLSHQLGQQLAQEKHQSNT